MYHYTLVFLLSLLLCVSITAQPNIYSESDIEYQTLFLDAQYEKHKGNTEKSIEIFKSLLKRNREADAVYYELAKAYVSMKDMEQAQKNAEKAVTLNPQNVWYAVTLAEIYESTRQYSKAISSYKGLMLIDNNNPAFYEKLAINQVLDKKTADAISTMKSLQSKMGINEENARRLFDICANAGKEKEAVDALTQLTYEYPDNTRYLSNLAGYQLEIGKPDEAKKTYEKLLSIDPNHPKASLAISKTKIKKTSGGTSEYLQSLMPLMENMDIDLDSKIKELMPHLSTMEKNDPSIESLSQITEKLIMLYPQEAKTHALRGDVLFYGGNLDGSEQSYEKAIQLDDRKYTLWDQWMINLWQNDKYEKLQAASYDAIDLFPNQANAFILHALSLRKNNKISEAADYLDEAGFIAGKNKSLKTAVEVAKNWTNMSKLDKTAITSFLNDLETGDLNSPIYFELIGDLYSQISDVDNSKKFWQMAIDMGAKESKIKKKMGV